MDCNLDRASDGLFEASNDSWLITVRHMKFVYITVVSHCCLRQGQKKAFCGPGGKEAYDRRNSASRADSAVRADMEASDFATLFRTHRWEWIRHRHTGG